MKVLLSLLITFSFPIILFGQEVCDNGVDDDGDGLIDLNDPDCKCSGFLTEVTSLIPNPSFEDTICCPSSFSQLNCAEAWIQASDATSDYFNICEFTHLLGAFSPPPPPPDGGGYAGFYNYTGYKEMVGACLDEPIEAGMSYRFSLFFARGTPRAAPLIVSIYGTPDCNDLPWSGYECPVGNGSWMLLGADTIEFSDSSWIQTTIEFDALQDIHALAIGGPCGAVSGSISYYFVDQLLVASVAAFDLNAKITQSGNWCANDLQLHASIDTVGGNWQWYRAGIALPGETSDSLNLLPYGTDEVYTVVYTLGGDCVSVEHTAHVEFFQDNMPDLIISPSCKGFSNGKAYVVARPDDTATYTYQWRSVNDTGLLSETDSLIHVPPGRYSLQIRDSVGCDTMLYFDIAEEDFNVSFLASDTLVCLGEIIQLSNTSDTHFTTYYWAFDNGDTSLSADPSPISYLASGTYRVMLAGAGLTCMDTAYQTIIVDQPIVPHYDAVPKEVCAGQPVYFKPWSDSTTAGISWVLDESERVELIIQHQYQHAFDHSGFFPVTVAFQSRACPDTSYTDTIIVYPLPEVDLGGDSSICIDGQPVYLKNLREAPLNPHHQVWSTGDTTDVLKVVHPGIYALSVTTDPIGCTTTELIEIRKGCYIDIPNAFTPNGDGQNDYFLPRQLLSEGLARFHMQVFNRWGQLVFETNRLDGRGWDGRYKDKAQPMGVYLYRIGADFSNGMQEQYEGNVTLIR